MPRFGGMNAINPTTPVSISRRHPRLILRDLESLLLVRGTGADACRRSGYILARATHLLQGFGRGGAGGGGVNILFLDQFSDPGGGQLCLKDLMPGILQLGVEAAHHDARLGRDG
jgi:hypothetical protein